MTNSDNWLKYNTSAPFLQVPPKNARLSAHYLNVRQILDAYIYSRSMGSILHRSHYSCFMTYITSAYMPSNQKADSRFFLGAVEACRESDTSLNNLQFYEVVHKFRPDDTIGYLDAVEKISAECNSPMLE